MGDRGWGIGDGEASYNSHTQGLLFYSTVGNSITTIDNATPSPPTIELSAPPPLPCPGGASRVGFRPGASFVS